jgi:TonB family protein
MKSKPLPQFFFLKNLRFLSFVAAALFHGTIAAFAIIPSNTTFINQQVMKVSFVAIPGSEKKHTSKPIEETKLLKNKNLITKASFDSVRSDLNKSNLLKETSGIQNSLAKANNSAQSDPIFNAAYLDNPSPIYPQSAKRKGIQGKVLVNAEVKTDGTANKVEILRSSGSEDLDKAALDAVKEWQFIPARRGGNSVQASVTIPVEFKII